MDWPAVIADAGMPSTMHRPTIDDEVDQRRKISMRRDDDSHEKRGHFYHTRPTRHKGRAEYIAL